MVVDRLVAKQLSIRAIPTGWVGIENQGQQGSKFENLFRVEHSFKFRRGCRAETLRISSPLKCRKKRYFNYCGGCAYRMGFYRFGDDEKECCDRP